MNVVRILLTRMSSAILYCDLATRHPCVTSSRADHVRVAFLVVDMRLARGHVQLRGFGESGRRSTFFMLGAFQFFLEVRRVARTKFHKHFEPLEAILKNSSIHRSWIVFMKVRLP